MPLRPFPFQLSIGTDIVYVTRIRNILVKAQDKPGNLNRFLRRFLTPGEQNAIAAEYKLNDRLTTNDLEIVSRHLAGRWAAKEAAIKAVTWRRLSFHDIVILRSPQRQSLSAIILDRTWTEQSRALGGGTEGVAYEKLDGQVARVSISHDGEYATAVCFAAEEPMEGDVGGEAAARDPL